MSERFDEIDLVALERDCIVAFLDGAIDAYKSGLDFEMASRLQFWRNCIERGDHMLEGWQ